VITIGTPENDESQWMGIVICYACSFKDYNQNLYY
jgi:hypothetical protein